jgi:hypothetical protein
MSSIPLLRFIIVFHTSLFNYQGNEPLLVTKVNIDHFSELPEPLRRKIGIGTSRIKVLQRENGEIMVKATQSLNGVNNRITQIKGDKASSNS